jgi:membrane fusion protein, multidrug efflux system
MKSIRVSVLLILAALVGALAWYYFGNEPSVEKVAVPKGIPVVVDQVEARDVPIWLTGLGTVQAYNTVTVRPRVSGSLDEVKFDEGQQVNAGDVLAQIDPRVYLSVLEQARAKAKENAALLANSKRELKRIRILVKSNAESQRLLDQAEATVAQYEALAMADEVAIRAAQLDVDFTTVRSPITGRTGVRLVDAGNLVTANQSTGLVVVTQLRPLSVILTLPQKDLPALQKRMGSDPTPLKVQTVDDSGKVVAEGELQLIDNQIDTATGTIRLKATFPNKDFALWPGQFVSARVLAETRSSSLVVPTQVIQTGLDGMFAYVVKPDQTVEPRLVKPGARIEDFTVIEEGLKAGETVVVDGQSKLKPGAKIVAEEKTP